MERYTVTASSLGSYFGQGFNSPIEQLEIDLGQREVVFDDEAKERMELGNLMEDACLNFFEYKLGILIVNRNTEVLDGFGGMMRLKMDGETVFNGEPTVVENKYSNSESKVFTDDFGYKLQVQAYMEVKGYKQALLCGMYQGKPLWRLIKRDNALIDDIKIVVNAVYGILNGIMGIEDYPWDIVEKYSNVTKPVFADYLSEDDDNLIKNYIMLQEESKRIDNELETIKLTLKDKFDNTIFETDTYKMTVGVMQSGGGFDKDMFRMTYPDIELDAFDKPKRPVKTFRVTTKKVKVGL